MYGDGSTYQKKSDEKRDKSFENEVERFKVIDSEKKEKTLSISKPDRDEKD